MNSVKFRRVRCVFSLCMLMVFMITVNIPITAVRAAQNVYDFEDGSTTGWVVDSGTWSIVADGTAKAYKCSSSLGGKSITGQAGWTNYSVEAKIKVDVWAGSSSRAGVMGRYTDSNNHYLMYYDTANGKINIAKRVNGVFTNLGNASVAAPSTGIYHSYRLLINKSTLKAYFDGVLIKTVTDTSLISGKAGLYVWNQTGYFDNICLADFSGIEKLEVFSDAYPKYFSFRKPESDAYIGMEYTAWKNQYSFYDGIEGKPINESMPGREVPKQYFLNYKSEFPDKYVLAHYNGEGRDPNFSGIDKYFAGHWMYYAGCKATVDISNSSNDTTISVENTDVFRTNIGLTQSVNEDIVIVTLDSNGKPDWTQSEQVRLLSKNAANSTISVRRGQFGTLPRAFAANQVYLASHVISGPWSSFGTPLWNYNFSADCPVNPVDNKKCIDVLSDEIYSFLGPGGEVSSFDGIEFDVLYGTVRSALTYRGVDTDGDSVVDNGYNSSGENRYLTGQYEFSQKLRNLLPDKLLLGDGQLDVLQRNFDQFNGAEYEGWPYLGDNTMEQWSSGINRSNFWDQHGAEDPMRFSYFVHKYKTDSEINVTRLDIAVPQYMEHAANTFADYINSKDDVDEMVKGAEREANWLGMPVGAAVRMAKATADQLGGNGVTANNTFRDMFSGSGMTFVNNNPNGKIRISSSNGNPIKFKINNVPTGYMGSPVDLTMFTTIKTDPVAGSPKGSARQVDVKITDANGNKLKSLMSWTDQNDFEASFYIQNVATSTISYEFTFEGSETVWLSNSTVNAGEDAIYREFENGLVLSNPSNHNYTFNLTSLLPGRSFHHLIGTALQSPTTNNGSHVGSSITLGPLDAIFLIKDGIITDTTPPVFTSGTMTADITPKDVKLTWPVADDDTKVVSYQIMKEGSLLETVSGAVYQHQVQGLLPNTAYSFNVKAVDLGGNVSITGPSVNVTTPSTDTTSPTWSNGTVGVTSVAQNSVALTWSGAIDNYSIVCYNIYANGMSIASIASLASVNTYTATGLIPNTNYTFRIEAIDNSGNISTTGPAVSVTTMADNNKPLWSTLAVLNKSLFSGTEVKLIWDKAYDEIGVTEYRIYKDGSLIASFPTTTNYLVTGLMPSTAYVFKIEAGDAAGNWTTNGPSLSITTP